MSNVIRSLVVKVGADLSDFEKKMKKISKELKTAGKDMTDLGKSLTKGVTMPLIGVGVALGALVKDAANAEKYVAQLDAVLKSTGGAAGVTRDQALSLAEAFEKTTKFSAEMALEAQSLLLTFTNIGKDVFPEATQAAADMATALGTDMAGQAIALGKALNDPIQGITALRRVGVSFTEAQMSQIKTMQESGDIMSAQKLILAELKKEFGGSAEAAGQTFGGQLEILKNQLMAIGEEVGATLMPMLRNLIPIIQDRIVPALKKAAEFTSELFEKFEELSPMAQKLILASIGLAAAMGPVLTVTGKMTTMASGLFMSLNNASKALGAGKGLLGVITAFSGPALIVVAAIAAITAAFVLLNAQIKKNAADLKNHIDDVAEKYEEQKRIIAGQIDSQYAKKRETLAKEQAVEEEAAQREIALHEDRLAAIQSMYDSEVESAKKSHDKKIALLNEEYNQATENYNDRISKIREEYGVDTSFIKSKTDVIKQSYDDQATAAKTNHDETMAALAEEYNKRLEIINAELSAELAAIDASYAAELQAYDDQIKAIDEKTKQEERALRDQRDAERIAELEKKIADAEMFTDKQAAEAELQEFLKEINRRTLLEQRDAEKASLADKRAELLRLAEEEKASAQAKAEEEKAALKADYEEKILLAKTDIDNRLLEIERGKEGAIRAIQEERIALETAEAEKLAAVKSNIEARIREEENNIVYQEIFAGVSRDNLIIAEEAKTKATIEELAKRKAEYERVYAAIDGEVARRTAAAGELADLMRQEEVDFVKIQDSKTSWIEKAGIGDTIFGAALENLATIGTFLRNLTGGATPDIPQYAEGTSFHPGGLALVGEAGPEILNLPKGTSVTPMGDEVSTTININATYNVTDKATAEYANNDLVRKLQGRGMAVAFR